MTFDHGRDWLIAGFYRTFLTSNVQATRFLHCRQSGLLGSSTKSDGPGTPIPLMLSIDRHIDIDDSHDICRYIYIYIYIYIDRDVLVKAEELSLSGVLPASLPAKRCLCWETVTGIAKACCDVIPATLCCHLCCHPYTASLYPLRGCYDVINATLNAT